MSHVGFWVRDLPLSSHMGLVIVLPLMNTTHKGGGRIICMSFATSEKKKSVNKIPKMWEIDMLKLTCRKKF